MKQIYLLVALLLSGGAITKASDNMDASNALAGTWVFSLGDTYLDNATLTTIEAEYEAKYDGKGNYDFWLFSSLDEGFYPFVGVYYGSKSIITYYADIISTFDYEGQTVYLSQEPIVFDPELGEEGLIEWVESIDATFNAEDNSLEFQPNQGILWGLYSDYDDLDNSFLGWIAGYDFEGAVRSSDVTNAISGIISENGVAEMYDLKGMKLLTPKKGEIAIIRDSKGARKVIIK
ncbi:MAG: hypothetical protein J1F43_07095 [Muribaculaceae bacterium]|nr:hypothetical protein [Muribaculaceae bacterium]